MVAAVGNLGVETDKVRRHLRYLIFMVEHEPLLREPLVDALYTLNRNVRQAEEAYALRPMRLGGFPGRQVRSGRAAEPAVCEVARDRP